MPTITVTFIRHGESTDNLQANAAGAYFASTKFTAIYASPLKRAYSTAQSILAAQPEPKPSFTISPDVREQFFGEAEGKPWSMKADAGVSRAEFYAQGVYPVIYDRDGKFPGGESLTDLQERAERAMNDIVMPCVWRAVRGEESAHIAVVSHGLCISELISALVRKDSDAKTSDRGGKWTGLMNTAWTRLTIDVDRPNKEQTDVVDPANLPPLKVKVTHVNQYSHLDSVKRQQGGIGSVAHDPAQKDIRAFFGGAAVKPELEEGRAASNVYDEAGALADGKN